MLTFLLLLLTVIAAVAAIAVLVLSLLFVSGWHRSGNSDDDVAAETTAMSLSDCYCC